MKCVGKPYPKDRDTFEFLSKWKQDGYYYIVGSEVDKVDREKRVLVVIQTYQSRHLSIERVDFDRGILFTYCRDVEKVNEQRARLGTIKYYPLMYLRYKDSRRLRKGLQRVAKSYVECGGGYDLMNNTFAIYLENICLNEKALGADFERITDTLMAGTLPLINKELEYIKLPKRANFLFVESLEDAKKRVEMISDEKRTEYITKLKRHFLILRDYHRKAIKEKIIDFTLGKNF